MRKCSQPRADHDFRSRGPDRISGGTTHLLSGHDSFLVGREAPGHAARMENGHLTNVFPGSRKEHARDDHRVMAGHESPTRGIHVSNRGIDESMPKISHRTPPIRCATGADECELLNRRRFRTTGGSGGVLVAPDPRLHRDRRASRETVGSLPAVYQLTSAPEEAGRLADVAAGGTERRDERLPGWPPPTCRRGFHRPARPEVHSNPAGFLGEVSSQLTDPPPTWATFYSDVRDAVLGSASLTLRVCRGGFNRTDAKSGSPAGLWPLGLPNGGRQGGPGRLELRGKSPASRNARGTGCRLPFEAHRAGIEQAPRGGGGLGRQAGISV